MSEAKNEAALQATAIMQDVENARAMVEKTKADAQTYLESVEAEANEKAQSIVSEAESKNKALIYDAEQRAYEMLEVAKTSSSKILADAQANSGTLLETAKTDAQTVVETANKNSSLKLEDARRRSESIVNEMKTKTGELYNARVDEAEQLYAKAKEVSENVTGSAGTKAAELLNASKEKAQSVLALAQASAEELNAATEQRANEALADADGIVEKRLSESKRLCAELLTRARARAEEMLEESRESGEEYLNASRNKAASLVVAAQNECERMLKLVRSEADGDGDIAYVIKMPDVVKPLPSDVDTKQILSAHGIDSDVDMDRPDLNAAIPEIENAAAEKTAPIRLELDPLAAEAEDALQQLDVEAYVASQTPETEPLQIDRVDTDDAFDDLFESFDFDVLQTEDPSDAALENMETSFRNATLLNAEQIAEARSKIAAIAAGNSEEEPAFEGEAELSRSEEARKNLENMLDADVDAIEKDLRQGDDLDERSDAWTNVDEDVFTEDAETSEQESDAQAAAEPTDAGEETGFTVDLSSFDMDWSDDVDITDEPDDTPGPEPKYDSDYDSEAEAEEPELPEPAPEEELFEEPEQPEDDIPEETEEPAVDTEGFSLDFSAAFEDFSLDEEEAEGSDDTQVYAYEQDDADEAAPADTTDVDAVIPNEEDDGEALADDAEGSDEEETAEEAPAEESTEEGSAEEEPAEEDMPQDDEPAEMYVEEEDEWLDFEEIVTSDEEAGADGLPDAEEEEPDGFAFSGDLFDQPADDAQEPAEEDEADIQTDIYVSPKTEILAYEEAPVTEIIDDTLQRTQILTEASEFEYDADGEQSRRYDEKHGKKNRRKKKKNR